MPHFIIQAKFPANEGPAEINFFGTLERETMQAVQLATCSALQASMDLQVGLWQKHPLAPNVMQFIVNIPGKWECRRTLQNVLRVMWLDVFESAGWSVASAADCEHGGLPSASSCAGQPEPEETKAAGGFWGECTNFILFKPAPSTGGCALDVEHGKAHAASNHPPGGGSVAGSDDGVKNESGGDDGEGHGGNSPRSHGLPLPEVVQRLLRENPPVLHWDPTERYYVVLEGSKFEDRFNQLRKVRQKHKNGTVERPFSRMHNFYLLERGDKWAKTGTIFRPKKASYAPAGYQNDHIDLVLPRKRSISASCESDTRAFDSQGLAALTAVLPHAPAAGMGNSKAASSAGGSTMAFNPAEYRMLSALMAAGLQSSVSSAQGDGL